jgi:Flp pilus assembly pilin Flp
VNYYMLTLYVSLQNLLERVSRREEGQTAVEYGLVLALIAVVITTAMALGLNGVVQTVVDKVNAAITGA